MLVVLISLQLSYNLYSRDHIDSGNHKIVRNINNFNLHRDTLKTLHVENEVISNFLSKRGKYLLKTQRVYVLVYKCQF